MKFCFLTILAVVAAIPLLGQERSPEQVLEWSREQVAEAELELKEAREAILAEKVPRIQELDNAQETFIKLKVQKEIANAARDSENVRLAELETKASTLEGSTRSVVNILLQFRRDFDTNVALVDRTKLEGAFLSTERSLENDNRLAIVEAGWDLVEQAIALQASRVGGMQSSGTLLVNSIENSGTFLSFGPYSYFTSNDTDAIGLVRETDDLTMRLANVGILTRENFDAALKGSQKGAFPVDPMIDEALLLEDAKVPLKQHLMNGGYWMIPILGFGLVSYVFAFWKALEIAKLRQPKPGQIESLAEYACSEPDSAKIESSLKALPQRIQSIFKEGVQHAHRSIETREAAMRQPFLKYRHLVESKLSLIALTASVAPLLGLLGTVTGMIKTFQLISIYGAGDAKSLSTGISEALVTTEFGLIVAIPALVAHAVLSRHVKKRVSLLTAMIDNFNHSLVEEE